MCVVYVCYEISAAHSSRCVGRSSLKKIESNPQRAILCCYVELFFDLFIFELFHVSEFSRGTRIF